MMILGIPDPTVAAALVLTVLSAAGCVFYGLLMWDREGDLTPEELAEENRWAAAELELERDLDRGGAR